MTETRTRSPRCPSIGLSEALNRIDVLYSKENKHYVAPDVAAIGLGYKSATNGAAASMIASLSYFGLLKRNKDGKIAVAPEYEKYKFAPEATIKFTFLSSWLREPKIFAELLSKYDDILPSDGALKYELIGAGFKPDSAEEAAKVFKESVNFVKSHRQDMIQEEEGEENVEAKPSPANTPTPVPTINRQEQRTQPDDDRRSITIFLPNQREAVLIVPRPFFNKDRDTIKRQLDAILTEEEESA